MEKLSTQMSDALQILPAPPLDSIVNGALQDIPKHADLRLLQGRVYDVRNGLLQYIEEGISDQAEQGTTLESEQEFDEIMSTLRAVLPPLDIGTVRQKKCFSAWRSALVAIWGLLWGAGIGQAIMYAGDLGFGINIVSLFAIIGAILALWMADYLMQSMEQGVLRSSWGEISWKKFKQRAFWFWCILFALSIVQDFFDSQMGLLFSLRAIGIFLSTGSLLPLLSDSYSVLVLLFLFACLLKRATCDDHEDFAQKLRVAATQWWHGASLITSLLLENIVLKKEGKRQNLQTVGSDLYSLASELPEAKRKWMEERLLRLGFSAPHETGELVWKESMYDTYIPLGHIVEGDACYVDKSPLLKDGLLLQKGTVRKIRS